MIPDRASWGWRRIAAGLGLEAVDHPAEGCGAHSRLRDGGAVVIVVAASPPMPGDQSRPGALPRRRLDDPDACFTPSQSRWPGGNLRRGAEADVRRREATRRNGEDRTSAARIGAPGIWRRRSLGPVGCGRATAWRVTVSGEAPQHERSRPKKGGGRPGRLRVRRWRGGCVRGHRAPRRRAVASRARAQGGDEVVTPQRELVQSCGELRACCRLLRRLRPRRRLVDLRRIPMNGRMFQPIIGWPLGQTTVPVRVSGPGRW